MLKERRGGEKRQRWPLCKAFHSKEQCVGVRVWRQKVMQPRKEKNPVPVRANFVPNPTYKRTQPCQNHLPTHQAQWWSIPCTKTPTHGCIHIFIYKLASAALAASRGSMGISAFLVKRTEHAIGLSPSGSPRLLPGRPQPADTPISGPPQMFPNLRNKNKGGRGLESMKEHEESKKEKE